MDRELSFQPSPVGEGVISALGKDVGGGVTTPPPAASPRARVFRIARAGIALALALALVASVVGYFTETRSLQAYINGRLVTLRAPIAGELLLGDLEPGARVAPGAPLGSISNPRIDRLEVREEEARSLERQKRRLVGALQKTIAQRVSLLSFWTRKEHALRAVEVALREVQIARAGAELEAERWSARVAQDREKRLSAVAGAVVSRELREEATLEARRAEAAVHAKQAALDEALTARKLTEAFVMPPQERALEVGVEIADLEQKLLSAEVEVETARAELDRVGRQLGQARAAQVQAPADGVVWSVDAKPKEVVEEYDPILRILATGQVWVDAFVSERDAADIHAGDLAEVRLLGPLLSFGSRRWPGRVETIRANTGRLDHGEEVAVPPPEHVRREVAVRVRVDWSKGAAFAPDEFLGVGRSVEVRFDRGPEGRRPAAAGLAAPGGE